MKDSIKRVKKGKPSFLFYIAHNVLLTPLPFQFYFPPQFFLIPSSTILLFSLLNVFISSSTIFIIFPQWQIHI